MVEKKEQAYPSFYAVALALAIAGLGDGRVEGCTSGITPLITGKADDLTHRNAV